MTARHGAAGGLSTTATDYARFLIEVLDPRPADAFRLTETSRDEMIRPQVKVDDGSSWALGWQILHHTTGDLLSHGGEVIGKLANGDTPLNLYVTG
jgi:CubicO group peptidase (beta-lactamase class C family)